MEPELLTAGWLDRLRNWPADVALYTLKDWPSRSKWWPSWFEIEEAMVARLAPRKAMLKAMQVAARAQLLGWKDVE